jgi:carboxyl-terminal processing protease
VKAGRIAALVAALVLSLGAGIWLGGHPGRLPGVIRDELIGEPTGLTAEAAEAIEDDYYRSVPKGELASASLRGMMQGLRRRYHDRFSDYFSPKVLEHFNEEISGRFSGVGLSVVAVKEGLRVEQVFHRSPAAKSGMRPGDVIVSVDGHSIAGESIEAATARVKGPEGTQVEIGYIRPPHKAVRDVTVTRTQITLPVAMGKVETVNGRKVGYVRLLSFSEDAHAHLRRAVDKVERAGAKSIVLDLRGNGGGLLEEAVLCAGIFLPPGEVVVSTKSRTQGDSIHKTGGGNLPARPLAVLIDRNTASAAEILTAALADDGNATVVGTRSYGKGVFQEEWDLANGGALKLTVGEYFTPNGTNLGGKGIQPDVRVRENPATPQDDVLERALRIAAARGGK